MLKPIKVERKILEKDVEAYLVRQVKKLGGRCLKWSSMNNVGVPDRVVILPGGVIWFIEVKRDNKSYLSKHQKLFFDSMAELGVTNCCVLHGKSEVDIFINAATWGIR